MALIIRFIVIIGIGLSALWTCVTGRTEVPITGRAQTIAFSPEEAARIGSAAYGQILAREQVIASGPQVERVRRITARLAGAAERLVDLEADWRIAILRSDDANAFALPGGGIGVNTGMLAVARSDDQLAAVIGHEIGHVIARHGAERMTRDKLKGYGTQALGMAIGEMGSGAQAAVMAALGIGAQFGLDRPFSRNQEREADLIGLLVMAAACFDPGAAPALWQAMQEAGRNGPPEFLSTHPSPGSRIETLEEALPQARVAAQDAGCAVPSG